MKKRTFITIISLIMVLSMAFSVSAADFEAGKHKDSSVVNIKGKIAAEDLTKNSKVTVSIIEDLGLPTQRVAHIQELEPNEIGVFEAKFKCVSSDNSQLKVCYNGKVVNDSLIKADIDGVSKLMDVNIVLLSDRGGAFNQKDWGEMPVHKYDYPDRNINATYQSKYTFEKTEGVQAYIKVENTYGLDVSFIPIIACYGENNKLLGTKIFDKETIDFADPVKTVQTDIMDLPNGTVRAKAFAWNKDKLIPFGDSNEGELDKINIILVGASTAQSWNAKYYPEEGFGRFLGDYFNPDYVTYYNRSVSGASTTTFLDEEERLGYWPNVIKLIEEDPEKTSIVIMELGPNDKNHTKDENGNLSEEKFKANLLKMYNDVVSRGGQMIFVGVTVDANKFDENGKLILDNMWTVTDVTDYKKDIAELTGSDFINCQQRITDFYNKEIERLGSPENLIGYYFRDSRYMIGDHDTDKIKYSFDGIYMNEDGTTNVYVEPELSNGNFIPKYTDDKGNAYAWDANHTNLRGADIVAQLFYEEIVESNSILKAYTK